MQTRRSRPFPEYVAGLGRLMARLVVITCLACGAGAQVKNSYVVRQVSFASGNRNMAGSLCLPTFQAGKVPVVVLVAGSIPGEPSHDAFPKLAHGLAEAGIASLQYHEEAKSPRRNSKVLDLARDEAVAALEFLNSVPEINRGARFLLGHSAGGTVAAYVVSASPGIRGVILAGAAVAPIDHSILMQQRIFLASEGKSDKQIEDASNSESKILADVRSGKIPADRMINGAPAGFWRDWMNRDPIGELSNSKVPALVLQDEQDSANQVDSERLQKQVEDMGPRAQLRYVTNLERYFLSAQEQSSDHLVQIISRWILKTASGK